MSWGYWGYQPGQSRDQLPADPLEPGTNDAPWRGELWLAFLGPALALIFLLLILFT